MSQSILSTDKSDGALMRDTRMVERKKTGRAKARKGVSRLSVLNREEANELVHLGQALIGLPNIWIQSCIHYPVTS
jgi:hypothetical protein